MRAIDEFAPKTIEFDNREKYTLSIGLGPGGFCFTISSLSAGLHLGLWSYSVNNADDIDECIAITKQAAVHFNQVVCSIDTDCWCVLPEGYAEPDNIGSIMSLNFGNDLFGPEKNKLYTAKRNGIECVYAADENVISKLTAAYPEIKITSEQFAALCHHQKKSIVTKEQIVVADLHNDKTDIYAIDEGKIIMANRFDTKEESDLTYHILNIYNKLGLDQQKTVLYISGQSAHWKTAEQVIKKYIRKIKEVGIDKDCLQKNLSALASSTKYYNLLTLTSCE